MIIKNYINFQASCLFTKSGKLKNCLFHFNSEYIYLLLKPTLIQSDINGQFNSFLSSYYDSSSMIFDLSYMCVCVYF